MALPSTNPETYKFIRKLVRTYDQPPLWFIQKKYGITQSTSCSWRKVPIKSYENYRLPKARYEEMLNDLKRDYTEYFMPYLLAKSIGERVRKKCGARHVGGKGVKKILEKHFNRKIEQVSDVVRRWTLGQRAIRFYDCIINNEMVDVELSGLETELTAKKWKYHVARGLHSKNWARNEISDVLKVHDASVRRWTEHDDIGPALGLTYCDKEFADVITDLAADMVDIGPLVDKAERLWTFVRPTIFYAENLLYNGRWKSLEKDCRTELRSRHELEPVLVDRAAKLVKDYLVASKVVQKV